LFIIFTDILIHTFDVIRNAQKVSKITNIQTGKKLTDHVLMALKSVYVLVVLTL